MLPSAVQVNKDPGFYWRNYGRPHVLLYMNVAQHHSTLQHEDIV